MRRFLKRTLVVGVAVALVWLARGEPLGPHTTHRAEWLAADDIQLRTLRAGTGDTTLLLLHGYGESLFGWRPLIDPLARHYRVVAVDLPGFGLSDKPPGSYDLPSMERRLEAFLTRWTQGPVVVVGHSLGGELAAALAMAHPDRIVALVLISPGGQGLSPLLDPGSGLTSPSAGWVTAAAAFLFPMHDSTWLVEPAARANYLPAGDPAYRAAAESVLAQFDFSALKGRWNDLKQPTLLLWGTQDPTIPFELGQAIAAALPCRRFVPLPGALHRPQQTEPDTVLAEMRRFLARPQCGID